jgi:transcriptional regulator with XRE-family HTH domain
VALRGGLQSPRTGKPQQNQISKILSSRTRGPSVETFVRAVEGLGISVSSFFSAIETGETDVLLAQIAARQTDADNLVAEAMHHLRRTIKLLEHARQTRHRTR